jgi:hypothetical protein
VSAEDAATLPEVYQTIAGSLTNRFVLVYDSAATGEAELQVAYRVDGEVLRTQTTVQLPSPPIGPGGEDGATAEPTQDPAPELAPLPDTAPAPTLDPLRPAGWVAPWMAPAGLAVLVIGLLGGLLYLHGWRLTDRFSQRP